MSNYVEKITVFYETEDEGTVTQTLSMSLEKLGGINLGELHRFLKRVAIASGFSSTLIEEYFGEDQYDY